MSIKRYVDNFVAPIVAELDKAKATEKQLIEKLKSRLVEEMEVNEKTRNNQVKLEEQLKIEKEKNASLQTERDDLTEMVATKDEVIKMLTNGAKRINSSREKDATIRKLRKENEKLRREQEQQQLSQSSGTSTDTGTKRRREECNETASIDSRVLRPRKERGMVFGFCPRFGPVELKKFGEVDFVDACTATFTIDQNGDVYLNGVKQNGITTRPIKATSDCDSHYVIDAEGDLWSWGKNECGELGHGDTRERETPKLIEALKGMQVKEVSTGDACAACITVDSSCFVWGDCDRFGFGDQVTTPIKLDRSIKSIAFGHTHALMIDTNDDVYAIGKNSHGELGLGVYEDRSSWTKVTNLAGLVIKVQCGYDISAILTTSGLFTMGYEFGGSTPYLVKLANVADISLTWAHILALTKNGKLYAWGENKNGECGIETAIGKKWIETPTRVRHADEKKYQIRQISAGVRFSLIRCAPKSQ